MRYAHAHKAEQARASSKWNARDTRARAQLCGRVICNCLIWNFIQSVRYSLSERMSLELKSQKIQAGQLNGQADFFWLSDN